ncbi:hypothetical protein BDW59DRAFT_144882 [Aspergillus cavernicola]|uniref:Uncharacterized protein n=1 Tax=Aspergillus cavernicola TaxID=176166 RepID=A0ABR4IGJ8_9EURO
MNSSSESMVSNQHKYILSANALAYWVKNFLGEIGPDYWNSPLTAPAEWWETVPVDRMFTRRRRVIPG